MNLEARSSASVPGLVCSPTSGRALSVLLVDDDPFMLGILEEMLLDRGVRRVSRTSGGTAALASMAGMAAHPDLIMCDLNMPGGDGFQFMQELGALQYSGAVVLMSGMDLRTMHSAALMARFHRLRIVGSLGKPISASSLGAVLANVG